MAKQTTVRLVDDMDGSAAEETISFAVGRDSYEIDLSAGNAATLRDRLAEFIAAARPVRGGKRSSAASSVPARSTQDRERVARIREWARENGYTISERGRIPAVVQEAYDKRDVAPVRLAAVPQIPVTPMVASSPAADVALAAAKPKAPSKAKGKTANGLPKVVKPVGVKVKAMTGMQTKAVEDMGIKTHEVAKSFVVFAASTPDEVLGMIRAAMQSYDGDKNSGSYAAMKAVVRKVEAADPKQVQVVEIAA